MPLLTEGIPARRLGHGHVAPAARPREEGVGRVGGVGRVVEDDRDQGAGDAQEGGQEGDGGVGGGAGAEL